MDRNLPTSLLFEKPSGEPSKPPSWLLSAFLPLSIFLVGVIACLAASSAFHKALSASNASSARLAAAHLSGMFETRLQTALAFSKLPILSRAVSEGDPARLRARLKILVDTDPYMSRSFVTDPSGRLWCDFPPAPETMGVNFSARAWYKGVAEDWKPHLSPAYRRMAKPAIQVVSLAVPVFGDAGKVTGILVCQFSLENLQAMASRITVGELGGLVLLDSAGLAVAHPGLSMDRLGDPRFASLDLLRETAGRGLRSSEYVDPVLGERQLAAVAPVEVAGQSWTVIAQQPARQAYRPLYLLRAQIFLAGLLLALAAGLALRRLSRARAKEDKLKAQTEEQYEELQAMAEELKDANAELEQVKSGLERTVEQRTQALAEKEQQFLQAQKMEAVGRLAGGVAHDFNNVLTVILGHAELVAESPQTEDDARSLAEITAAGERAARLTAQLLAFARRQVVEPVPMDFNRALSGLKSMLDRLLGETIQVELRLDPALGAALADPGQMDQVLINLAVNAKDAMPGGGRLILETSNADLDDSFTSRHGLVAPGPYVMVSVTDTGNGMSAEVLDRIFEPFFTTKERGKGTGLGLAMAHGAIRQAGGHIFVYSEPGKGSVFKLYLPRVDAGALPRAGAPGAAQEMMEGGATILIAEDEEPVRKLAERMLVQAGYAVLSASSPSEALELAQSRDWQVDLLLTDMVMPEISGLELAAQMKHYRPQIKVLYMSGYTEAALPQETGQGSVFLQKPFAPATLKRKISELLSSAPL